MDQRTRRLLATLPMIVLLSFGVALLAIWAASRLFALTFNPTTALVTALLVGASAGTTTAAVCLTRRKSM
ncbi:MAG: hypothetical protein ACE5JH_06375 [Acidobacteriota bacterium]